MINCEINYILTWSENCVLTDMLTQAANPNADPAVPEVNAKTNETLKMQTCIYQYSPYQLKMIINY